MMLFQKEYLSNPQEYLVTTNSDDVSCIRVYTSNSCPFCSKTLEIVRDIAQSMEIYQTQLQVIEKKIEDLPNEAELNNILAIPLTIIGESRIVGLPREDEVKDLIHQAMLADAFKRAK